MDRDGRVQDVIAEQRENLGALWLDHQRPMARLAQDQIGSFGQRRKIEPWRRVVDKAGLHREFCVGHGRTLCEGGYRFRHPG